MHCSVEGKMKAKDIALFLNAETIGNPLKDVTKPGYLYTAKPDELAYCFLKNDEKDLEAISKTDAGIVICPKHLRNKLEQIKVKPTLILSGASKYDFAKVLQEFFVKEKPAISTYSYVGKNVKIGKDADIHPSAVIYDDTELGNNVTIRANAVLGAEGLDYGRNRKGELKRIPHVSKLIVEDDVDVGSNTTVQKGMLRPTIIGKGTKIGPNCDIGHEVKIGQYCIIAGMTLVAGATEIGDHAFIAPHSTIKNSIKIGSNAFIGIGSLVIRNVPDGTAVVGRPATEIGKFRKHRKRLKELLGED
jgi:UDP-3-O-[3-hydroxymyristoyl] glucosamine N-acyltransferase